MKTLTMITALSLALTAGAAHAQSAAGAEEYVRACAGCHGLTGHGDGPLAEYMTVEVPDLTVIAMRNGGVFPWLEMIQIIDGRTGLRPHGSPMPIWGDRFEVRAAAEAGDYGAEVIVRGRILSLATHLEAIQQ